MEKSPEVSDDGLVLPEAGSWAETKYRLIGLYAALFSTGMKWKWDRRVYVDLYAGAGYARLRNTQRIVLGSPLIALTVADPFDKYVFCEENRECLDALQRRTSRLAPAADASYIQGDCNAELDSIVAVVPKGSHSNRILTLCVVDPFDFGIKFETLRKLSSSFYIDFLVLLAIGMDANRNYEHYVEGNSTKIDEALGNTQWRDRWKSLGAHRSEFRQFLATEFSASMESIGYLHQELYQMKLVRSDDKNLPLYYLTLFSKNELAYRYWEQVLKYSTDQTSMF
jgi:three-Cys-motif partner protein